MSHEPLHILLVSQMYPSPRAPALGTFVHAIEQELAVRGHRISRAVVDHQGGSFRHVKLLADTTREARRSAPDVVYAHFLVPAGLWAVLAGRAPVVVTAHGQDVENARARPLARTATRLVLNRAAGVIAVSGWLRDRLLETIPEAEGRVEVIDCGVDTERFAPRSRDEARSRLGWASDGTGFLCLGSLTERKNVLRLARAFEQRGEGALVFVGEGPLLGALENRAGIRLVGAVPGQEVAEWIAACDVLCQPSMMEPFGLATLEAMASARSVVASRVGGQREFVTAESGVLVDPEQDDALVEALGAAAALPRPNYAARQAALAHDLKSQVDRIEAILERAARDRRA